MTNLELAREEYARRYIIYASYGRMDDAYFWYVAYCYGKDVAIKECL